MQSSGCFSDGSLAVLGSPRPLHKAPHHVVLLRVRSRAPPPFPFTLSTLGLVEEARWAEEAGSRRRKK
jgi:hypothetical protein